LVNIDKAKEHLDWEPKISFEEGVDRTVKGLWEMRDDD
jgi:nucleoside-diphosphate-sugar epimerase